MPSAYLASVTRLNERERRPLELFGCHSKTDGNLQAREAE